MRTLRFWLPVLIGLLVTPLFYLLLPYTIRSGADHAGAGMVQLVVVYPIPMLTMLISNPTDDFWLRTVTLAAVWLQFPLYGFIIGYATLRKTVWLKILAGIAWVHLIAIVAFMAILAIQIAL